MRTIREDHKRGVGSSGTDKTDVLDRPVGEEQMGQSEGYDRLEGGYDRLEGRQTGWRVDRRGGGWTDGVEGGYDMLEGRQTGWRVDRRGGGWTDGVEGGQTGWRVDRRGGGWI